ncbi:MAG: tetratricopeptide (TPR) repeat protein [Hyphomicrobiaceae bacterium]|jgi:tetratricopeptide (TPR) repeat protein
MKTFFHSIGQATVCPSQALLAALATLATLCTVAIAGCAGTASIGSVLGIGDENQNSPQAEAAHAERTGRGLLNSPSQGHPRQNQPKLTGDDRNNRGGRSLIDSGDLAGAERSLRAQLTGRPGRLQAGDLDAVRLLVLLAETQARAGRGDDAELTLTRALVLAPAFGPASVTTSQRGAHLHMGRTYEGIGDDAQAEAQYTEALTLCDEALERENETTCNAERDELARLFEFTNRWEEAEPIRMQALSAVQRDAGAHDLRLAIALGETAAFFERHGKYQLAEPLFARAADVWETSVLDAYDAWRSPREGAPVVVPEATVTSLTADHAAFTTPVFAERELALLTRLGRVQDTTAVNQRLRDQWLSDTIASSQALGLLESINAVEPSSATATEQLRLARDLHAVGWVALNRDQSDAALRLAQAEELYQLGWKAADARQRRLHAADRVALALRRARLAHSLGEAAARVAILDAATTLADAELPDSDIRRYEPIVARAAARRESANTAEAESILLAYGDAITAIRGATHPDFAWGLRNLAWVYEALGDHQSAVAVEHEAKQVWKNWSPAPAF